MGIMNLIFSIKKGKHDMFKGVYWGISEEPLKGGRVVGGGTGGKGGRRRRRRRIRRIRRRRRRRRQRS